MDSYLPGGMSQRIVMIDTVALTGIYGNGPPNDDVGNPPDPEYAKLMWKWIEKTLSEVSFFVGKDHNFCCNLLFLSREISIICSLHVIICW